MSTGVSAGLVRAAASVQLPVQTWTVYLFILLSCTELLLPLPVYSTVYSELIEANTLFENNNMLILQMYGGGDRGLSDDYGAVFLSI